MTIRQALVAAALASLAAAPPGAARAEDLQPVQGQSIDLGTLTGTAYYTVEPGGFHVVATLADRRSGDPVRLEAVLASGQRMMLSTPGGRSGAPHTVEISRQDGEVLVHAVTLTN